MGWGARLSDPAHGGSLIHVSLAPAVVDLRLLDGYSLSISGRQITGLPTSFFRIIAVAMLASRRRNMARSRLSALFWADLPAHNASANLRQLLARIRQFQIESGVEILRIDHASVTLCLDGVECDLADLLLELDAGPAGLHPSACASYQGDLLAGIGHSGVEFEEWLSSQREDLRYRVITTLADGLTSSPMTRIPMARRLISIDRCNEEAYRTLMLDAAQRGRLSRVHELFQLCCEHLRRELSAVPTHETVALFERLIDALSGDVGGPGLVDAS